MAAKFYDMTLVSLLLLFGVSVYLLLTVASGRPFFPEPPLYYPYALPVALGISLLLFSLGAIGYIWQDSLLRGRRLLRCAVPVVVGLPGVIIILLLTMWDLP